MTPPAGVSVSYVPRGFTLTWAAVPGASSYEVLLDPDGAGPAPAAPAGVTAATTLTLTDIPLHASLNATFKVRACSGSVCGSASAIVTLDLTQAIGYVKASNTRTDASFGGAVALSGDGTTLAVGSHGESSGAGGVNSNQADVSAPGTGAVYVFVRNAGQWVQQAYVKPMQPRANTQFGYALALSSDGHTLAVTALRESSAATGINGDESNTAAPDAGAAYVFVRSAGAWSQQAYVKASNTEAGDLFGYGVAVSADGSTLFVSSLYEASGNGNQADNSAPFSGAAYVFVRSGATWTQQAFIKPSTIHPSMLFGRSVAASGDGNLLAVGAAFDPSNATGVNGNASDTSMPDSGAAHVFVRTGTTWTQQAYLKASNTRPNAWFGSRIAVSADGSTVAVASEQETSNATGINGNQGDSSAFGAGAVYVFRKTSGSWAQEAYVKASNTAAATRFGWSLTLSGDGSRLLVGATDEDGAADGVGGDQADQSASNAGAAYLFARSGGAWSQQAYLKPSNTAAGMSFGSAVAMTADARLLAIGAQGERSGATGIGGNQADTSVPSAGAVYLY